MTERLWLEHPSRRAGLAKVTALRGDAFLLDRSIFSPGGSAYRHPQPPDRGEVWLGGDKRILRRAFEHRGELRHLLEGAVPKRGQQVRCLLDADRREAVEHAHVALHLVLSALLRGAGKGPALPPPPRVLGGWHARIILAARGFDPKVLAGALVGANEAVAARQEVRVEWATREGLHGVDPQAYADGLTVPGPPDGPVRVVRIGDSSALPCDGTFRSTTAGLGRIVAPQVRRGGAEVVIGLRVLRAS